jgi:hypothetical protein
MSFLEPQLSSSRPEAKDLAPLKTKVDKEGIRKARLELLAAIIWAKLGDSRALVQETDPNELKITLGDLSWVLTIKDTGKVSLSGFKSGVEQYIGKLPESNTETAIIEISNNAMDLINEDISENSEPPPPPISFGPPEEEDSLEEEPPQEQDQSIPPEETAQGDQTPPPPDMNGLSPNMGQLPMDLGMGTPSMPPGQPMQPPMPSPGGMPLMQGLPGQPMQPPMSSPNLMGNQPMPPGMPMAGRGRIKNDPVNKRGRIAAKRIAISALDSVASELQQISSSLEEGEDGPFVTLARRIDRVTNTLEQSEP